MNQRAWNQTTPGRTDHGDPRWRDTAACRDKGTDLWYPPHGGNNGTVVEAKAICAGCPVRTDCLDYALATHQRFGIWGGLTTNERKALTTAPPAAPAAPPAAVDLYKSHAATIGNHNRWHAARDITVPGCRWCDEKAA